MVGLERSMLPLVGERDFDLALEERNPQLRRRLRHHKALANLAAGGLADRVGPERLSSSTGCSPFPCNS